MGGARVGLADASTFRLPLRSMLITVWLVVNLVHGVHRAHGVRPVPFRWVVQ